MYRGGIYNVNFGPNYDKYSYISLMGVTKSKNEHELRRKANNLPNPFADLNINSYLPIKQDSKYFFKNTTALTNPVQSNLVIREYNLAYNK